MKIVLNCSAVCSPKCFSEELFLSQVLVQAIKEAKEQHPDMSVTKVVVHQETEIAEE